MAKSRYLVAKKFSLTPNKAVIYSEVNRYDSSKDVYCSIASGVERKNLDRAFHNFKLSKNAHRNLRKKIEWLYYLAKPKSVTTLKGKKIYNFKCAFITLTLPSKQVHPTSYITSEFFNQWLTEMRKRFKMMNFVWRIEFQKNGNVHYHVCTDTYLDYFTVRRSWNRIINKGGYIDSYQNQWKGLKLSEYIEKVDPLSFALYSEVAKAYASGCKDDWRQPNSVDCKSVKSGTAVSFYISKYFGKADDEQCSCNELDTEENSKHLRLWFCSRSLSKLHSIKDYDGAVTFNPALWLRNSKKVIVKHFDYCTVIYYDIRKLSGNLMVDIRKMLHDYSKRQGYIPSG